MEIKLFKKENRIIRKISNTYSVKNFITSEHSQKLSVATSEGKNHKEMTKTSSDRVYYILEGKITINETIKGKSGDLILIPANTEYKFVGTFKAILINSPPFQKANEHIIK